MLNAFKFKKSLNIKWLHVYFHMLQYNEYGFQIIFWKWYGYNFQRKEPLLA